MKRNGVIYKISFNGTDKFYIGSTVVFNKRKTGHSRALEKGIHRNHIMQNIYKKHGEPVFEIIEEVERWNCPVFKVLLLNREQYYIDLLNPYINIHKVAGSPLGIKRSEETKKKMSLAHLGGKWSKERANNSKGRKKTAEHKKNMRISLTKAWQALSKLTPTDIRNIRKMWESKDYTQVSLSLIYDVSSSYISDIINNKTWKNI